MAWKAIDQGAAGVDMGRNIFQSDSPIGMLRAVRGVVHDGLTPEQALEVYREFREGSQDRELVGSR
jgi:putative autoinducer-2 (AI-2) aldolase